jgi:hypothetical protein
MNRSGYFDYIEEKLNLLATRINARGKLNILNLHNHSENFYAYFLNELYDWDLGNLNEQKQNVEAIDLIDHSKKVVIQVSSTNTKQKVEDSLKKELIKTYATYTFKFISIANDCDDLKIKSFANPHNILFSPSSDIIDKKIILNYILSLDIDKQKSIYEFIRKELGNEVDIVKLDTNLALIINILSKERWDGTGREDTFNPFEINRKIEYNELKATKELINEYKIYHYKIDKKYEECDLEGANKSYSILRLINRYYIEENMKSNHADTVFINVSNRVLQRVQESGNFIKTEFDTLVLCVDILIVDAFIRCKIFKNPENYNHADS